MLILWLETPDFLEALFAPEDRFDLGDGDCLAEDVFLNVVGGLALPTSGRGLTEELIDESDLRRLGISHPALFSEVSEKRNPGTLMSCFEIRF